MASAGVLEAAPDAAAAAANGDVDAIADIMELSPFRIERFYAQYEHSTRSCSGSVCDEPDRARTGFGRANMPDALRLLEKVRGVIPMG